MSIKRANRAACGCRVAVMKRRGHRPACDHFNPERAQSARNVARFRRAIDAREGSMDHLPRVILGA